jgi:hypothetical protein
LPRITTTSTKIINVHKALPTLPANGLRVSSPSAALSGTAVNKRNRDRRNFFI